MKTKWMLALGVLMMFGLMMAGPAVTHAEDLKGVCVGGGEWVALLDPSVEGNTSFSLKANFPGNANGGNVLVTYKNGDFLLIDSDPDYSAILYGDWWVVNKPNVEGYAFWGSGPVADTNIPDTEGSWYFFGAYDGGESSNNEDLLVVWPIGSEGAAIYLHTKLVDEGEQLIPLWVSMSKGNTIIKVENPEE